MALAKRIIKTQGKPIHRVPPLTKQALLSTLSGPQLDPQGCSPMEGRGPPVARPSTLHLHGFKPLHFSEPQLPHEKGY